MKKLIVLLLGLAVPAGVCSAQEMEKQTFVYSIKGADTLRLDRYSVEGLKTGVQPCLVFMFGGGFAAGARDKERYVDYFRHFVRNGFTVVSIDYRLGLRPIVTGEVPIGGMGPKDFLAKFENAVFMSVEDLFDATGFILANADEWGIDSGLIITSGSSAGGIAVLQGEYERVNRSQRAQRLPEDFRYAGVIAFAGAVYGNEGKLRWNSTPAPLLMFHGDADQNVPYGKKRIFRHGLYGSSYLAKRYSREGHPYWLYTEVDMNHVIALSPMKENLAEMDSFISKYIMEERNLQTETSVSSPDRPKARRNFGIKDFVKANFGKQSAVQ